MFKIVADLKNLSNLLFLIDFLKKRKREMKKLIATMVVGMFFVSMTAVSTSFAAEEKVAGATTTTATAATAAETTATTAGAAGVGGATYAAIVA